MKMSALGAELSTHESYLPCRYYTSGPPCCCTPTVDDVQVEGRQSVAVPRAGAASSLAPCRYCTSGVGDIHELALLGLVVESDEADLARGEAHGR